MEGNAQHCYSPLGHNVSLTNSIGTTSLLAAACLADCDMNRAAEAAVTVAEMARCALNMVVIFDRSSGGGGVDSR